MKIIKIFQENNETVELIDNDDDNRIDYTSKLKDMFESNEVMILETSSASIILRPHKISSILIIDDDELSGEENNDELIQNSEDFIRG